MISPPSPKGAIAQPSPISVRDFSTPTLPTGNNSYTVTDSAGDEDKTKSDGNSSNSSRILLPKLNFVGAATAFASTPIKDDRTKSASSTPSQRSSESSQSSTVSEGSSWYTRTVTSSGGATATVSASLMDFENLFSCGAQTLDDSFSTLETKRNALSRRYSSRTDISMCRSFSALDEDEESMKQIMSFTKGEAVINLDEASTDGKASLSWVLREGNRTEVRVAKIPYDASICLETASKSEEAYPNHNHDNIYEAGSPNASTVLETSSSEMKIMQTPAAKANRPASASAPVKKKNFFKSIWKHSKKDCGEF
jgi:hypothetical protein